MQPVDVVGSVCDRGDEVAIRHPPVQPILGMQQRSCQLPAEMWTQLQAPDVKTASLTLH